MDVLEAMKKEMFRRRLSRRTIGSYLFYVRKFLRYCHKSPKEFSKKDCREFLETYSERGVSGSTLNVVLNSLRFMMQEILHKTIRFGIKVSKTPKRMPVCLTREEAKRLIDGVKSPKHRLLIALMYGAGLRVSEAVKLKPEDLDLGIDMGWVRHGKGDKDRPFVIPRCLKEKLAAYQKRGFKYIFPGQNGHLSVRSVQQIIKAATKEAKITKNIHPHTLRHSFATHVLETNDITTVQGLLGHSEARTTMTYLHMEKPKLINVKSPLDE